MDKLRNIIVCVGCQDDFDKREMLEGRDHVLYCGDCFRNVYCAASGDSKSQESTNLHEKLFPYPEIFAYNKRQRAQSSYMSQHSSTLSLSKRPIQCPKANCNKFVSLFNLESHFKYEHKEVPIILTQLDARSALEFYPRDVAHNVTQCIVLLNVINHDFANIFPRTSQDSTTALYNKNSKPVMVLLTRKISNSDLSQFDDSLSSTLDSDKVDSESTLTYVEECTVLHPNDKIIIWMASNIYTNLSYTVAASTLCNKIRQKYFGPMLTLGDSPLDLCRAGTCLMLTHFHINAMTNNGTRPLAIDVVVHSPD